MYEYFSLLVEWPPLPPPPPSSSLFCLLPPLAAAALRTIQFGPCWVVTSSPPWCFEAQNGAPSFSQCCSRATDTNNHPPPRQKWKGGKLGGIFIFFTWRKCSAAMREKAKNIIIIIILREEGRWPLKGNDKFMEKYVQQQK
jgi:hypothetical protein